jgi:hypothetical protein
MSQKPKEKKKWCSQTKHKSEDVGKSVISIHGRVGLGLFWKVLLSSVTCRDLKCGSQTQALRERVIINTSDDG